MKTNNQHNKNHLLLASTLAGVLSLSAAVAESMPRIIGGNVAADNEFPFVAALLDSNTSKNTDAQFCGASIIAPNWAMTAAHCILGQKAENIDVLIKTNVLDGSGKRITAKNLYIHDDYLTRGQADLALIELSEKADVPAILPLQPGSGQEGSGKMATVIGWGLTQEEGNPSEKLMKVDVPIVSDTVCGKAYSEQFNAATEICAGLPQGGKDACQGDSGGPLFVKNNAGQTNLVGVVSWGEGCAQKEKFGVYTQVSSYSNWIQKVQNGAVEPSKAEDISLIDGSDGSVIEPDFTDSDFLGCDDSGNVIVSPYPTLEVDFTHSCSGLNCTFKANVKDSSVQVEEYVWDIFSGPDYEPYPVVPDTANVEGIQFANATDNTFVESNIEDSVISLDDFYGVWKTGQSISNKFPKAGKYSIMLGVVSKKGEEGFMLKELTLSNDSATIEIPTFEQTVNLENGEEYITESAYLDFGQNINMELNSPKNSDFDLFLEYFDQDSQKWKKVEAYASPNRSETVSTTTRQAGQYRVRVNAYQGAGEFNLKLDLN